MDISRLRTGEKIAAVAALALLILMFLPWFGLDEESATTQSETFQEEATQEELEEAAGDIGEQLGDVSSTETSVDFSAWESFGLIDVLLLLVVLVVLGLAAMKTAGNTVAMPVAPGVLIAALGIVATLLVLYRVIDPPGVSFLDYGREFGVFLGLIAAAAIAFGGWRSMQEEGTTFSGEADRLGDRGAGPGAGPGGTTPGAGPSAGTGTTGTTGTTPPPGGQPPSPGGPAV